MSITYIDAVESLAPDKFSMANEHGEVRWKEDASDVPSEAELQAELTRLKTEYASQAYARNRQAEYPDSGTQFNKIYDDGITKWKSEMVDPVKAKWPKDNSGPK